MKQTQLIALGLISMIFFSCARDDDSDYNYSMSNTIYDESNQIDLKNFLILISIKATGTSIDSGMYVVTDKLNNILIKVNGDTLSKFVSEITDTTNIQKTEHQGVFISHEKVEFLTVASVLQEDDFLSTAGNFAAYLNQYQSYVTGDYIGEVNSFEIISNSNDTIRLHPRIFEFFTITPDIENLFWGNYEVTLNFDNL